MKINSSNIPVYSDNYAHKIMANGATTIISIIKPVVTNNFSYVWTRGVPSSSAIVAMVIETNAFAVIAWDGPRSLDASFTVTNVLARVTNIPNFTNQEHFVVFRSYGRGSTLSVDNLPPHSTTHICPITTGYGGFGAFSKGAGKVGEFKTGYKNKPSSDGFWLNDWRVYNAYLTDKEIAKIRREFWPTGFSVVVR